MPRPKKSVHAHIYAVGSLVTMAGQPDTISIDAVTDDGRHVYIDFPVSDFSAEKFGKNKSRARRMRSLAETLIRHADRLDNTPDSECGCWSAQHLGSCIHSK